MDFSIHRPVMVDAAKLKPAPYNPRRISRQQLDALKASIAQNGFVEPVVAQRGTLVLIGGHQRLEALRQLCRDANEKLPKIPAVLLDVDDRRARLMNVALNRIDGEFDDALLGNLLSGLGEISAVELLGTGLSDIEVAALLVPELPENETTTFGQSVTLTVRFDTVEERDAAKALLSERAQRSGKKASVVLRDLLGS